MAAPAILAEGLAVVRHEQAKTRSAPPQALEQRRQLMIDILQGGGLGRGAVFARALQIEVMRLVRCRHVQEQEQPLAFVASHPAQGGMHLRRR